MRPLPISEEILAELNAGEAEPDARWLRITMNPAPGDEGNVEPVEVAVLAKRRAIDVRELPPDLARGVDLSKTAAPIGYLARVAVTKKDLAAIEATGEFRLMLHGERMQPWALWAIEPDTGGTVADAGETPTVLERLRVLEAFVGAFMDLDVPTAGDEANGVAAIELLRELGQSARSLANLGIIGE